MISENKEYKRSNKAHSFGIESASYTDDPDFPALSPLTERDASVGSSLANFSMSFSDKLKVSKLPTSKDHWPAGQENFTSNDKKTVKFPPKGTELITSRGERYFN